MIWGSSLPPSLPLSLSLSLQQVTQINTHLTELKESQASQPQIIVSSQPSSSSSSSSPSVSDNEQEDGSGRKDEELLKLKTALNSIVNEAMTKRGVEVIIIIIIIIIFNLFTCTLLFAILIFFSLQVV